MMDTLNTSRLFHGLPGRPLRPVVALILAAAFFAAIGIAPRTAPADSEPGKNGLPGEERRYLAVQIEPLELIEALPSGEPSETQTPPTPTAIKPADLAQIRRSYKEAFERELQHILEVKSEAGPRTLRLDALLIGLELDRQMWLAPATFKFKTVDPLTFVVVVRDSVTGEVVHRLAILDKPLANRLLPQTETHYWEHLRRLFRRLAIRARWQLAEPLQEPAQ